MESKLRITLPDGRTFEMPDVHENRDLYERMNRNAKSDRDHVKIETVTASPPFEDKPVEAPAQPENVEPVIEQPTVEAPAQPTPRPRQTRTQAQPADTSASHKVQEFN